MNIDELIKLAPAAIVVIGVISILINFYNNRRSKKSSLINDEKRIISELIQELNSVKSRYHFGHYGPSDRGGSGGRALVQELTIFEITDLYKYPGYDPYENSQVLFKKGSNNLIDIDKYLNNPILPNYIKDSLSLFQSKSYDSLNYNDLEKTIAFVGVESNIFLDSQFYTIEKDTDLKLGDGIAYQSLESFKQSVNRLMSSISKWSKKNNVPLSIRYEEF